MSSWSYSDARIMKDISESLQDIAKELKYLNKTLQIQKSVDRLPKLEDLNF